MLVFTFCMNYFKMKNNEEKKNILLISELFRYIRLFIILLPIKNDYIKNMLFSEPYLQSFKHH